ncbi:MAG TPA: helical backbone metal receptor [Cytophagaceae bacterium]|jgi:iron complex transport system substrate-binding protein|nr:helical backbone metal receptor [Cytophagaceae bacterium]
MLKYIICCLAAGVLTACSEQEKKDVQEVGNQELVVADEMGRMLRVHQPVRRILPLCASSEETMVLLCDSQAIVGRTPECSYPEWIVGKPLVNNYPLDIEKVVTLKPDLIVSKEGMLSLDQLKKLESLGMTVYMQRADDINGIASSIKKLGDVIGQKEKGDVVAQRFKDRFDSLRSVPRSSSLSAIGIISSDPIYVYGHSSYLTDVLSSCGLENAIDSSIAQSFPVVDQEYLLKADPDFLLFPSEQKEIQELFVKFPLLKKTKAYRLNHCLYINGDWLSRPGPELIKAAVEISRQVNTISNEKR